MYSSCTLRSSFVSLVCVGIFCAGILSCGSPSGQPPVAAEERVPSYAEEAATNAAVRLNMLGDSALQVGNYPAAISFYQLSMDSAAANADSFPYYDSKLDLAYVHDRLGELNTAIQMAEPVVEAFIRSEDSSRIGRAYSTLASFYGKANMPEKERIATQKGFEILKNYGSLIERCAAYNQMAFVFSGQQHWDQALPMLDTALLFMQASGVLDQLPSIYLNLGNCHRNLHNWPKARFYLQQSAELADSLGQMHVRSKAIERISQVAESQGDHATALRLYKQSISLKDSILNKEKLEDLHALEVSYQTKEKELQISSLQLEQQAARARRNFTFALALLVLAGLVFWLYRVRQKLNSARQVLTQKQHELRTFAALLLAKNAQLSNLENAVQDQKAPARSLSQEGDEAEADSSVEDTESLFNSQILTHEDWESFKHRFEQAYPGYLLRARTTYPDLSGAEERLFLLIKLGFNSQEIADTLGISGNGVKKGRQRLRKRLNLRVEEDLEQFVARF